MKHAQQDSGRASGRHRGRSRDFAYVAGRRVPRWLRVAIPAALILVWLFTAAIAGPFFGRVSEVSSNDQTDYLPASSDAAAVQQLIPEFSETEGMPAILLFVSDKKLDDQALSMIGAGLDEVANISGVGTPSPVIPSEDGLAAEAFVPITSDSGTLRATLGDVREAIAEHIPDGVTMHVTGPAGFIADLVNGFSGIDGILLGVALIAVFVILVLVYRSILLPITVLATSLFALSAALLSVWWLAKSGALMLSGQIQGILFILVIGATTDYALLYVSRFREALTLKEQRWEATWEAIKGTWEPIVASGGTVIAGLLCLMFSDLKSNSGLGPVAAVGIVFAILAALTLLPALLAAFGRTAFWPKRPRFDPKRSLESHGVAASGLWGFVARMIKKRHRAIWIVTAVALGVVALGFTQLQANGIPQSDVVLGQSDSRTGQQLLGEHFPGGSGSPVYVVTDAKQLQDAANVLLDTKKISAVSVVSADSPSNTAPVTKDGISAFGPPGTPAPEPTVVNGQVLLQGTLDVAADSDAAIDVVRQLRADYASSNIDTMVGGVSATALDTDESSVHDRNLIIPLVLIVIFVILMLLLRSIVTPLLLVLSTVLSFGTAMGVAALVFNHIFQFPGADAAVPLYGFVFLVALGIDYNIFLMTRVREEALLHGPREGVLRGVSITGSVITSAGLVLAATFAALSVIPILFLAQIAFIVAFGVLLDTFIVRSLLVPSLVYDLGRAAWWPAKLSRKPVEAEPVATPTP